MPEASATRLRLRPADSFDLIRLLARSQNDARKAVCELVQNSLDAGARHVSITWFTHKKQRALRIEDDGRGVFPGMDRKAALQRIATTIGHSHKRSLTPAQRRELMALGKYGIGLLGFWAVGRQMEIRSRVGGGAAWRLVMVEDSPEARVERARPRGLQEPETWTEVTIFGVHPTVERQIRPQKLHAYLASELRGQLLSREVSIRLHDKVARGRAVKEFRVRAERFRGMPLRELTSLAVPGHEEARLELYLVPAEDDRHGRVALACGGTTVLDDVADIEGTGEPRPPWDSGRFEGVIDFPQLEVAPGTRRGFRHDAAAAALLGALPPLEDRLRELLAEDEERRREELDKNLARRLKQVFRRIPKVLPEYDLFDVRRADGAIARAPTGETVAEEAAAGPQGEDGSEGAGELLFEPGPLAQVTVSPARSRLPPGSVRAFTARARDADGRPAAGAVAFTWRLIGPGSLEPDGHRATYTAADAPGSAAVEIRATQGAIECAARADVTITDDPTGGEGIGIPEPVAVQATNENWRSRLRDGTWEYNAAHRDYLAASQSEARRLRYLVHLFAKEVVLRNFGRPGDGAVLERMVEVLTHLQESPNKKAGAGAKTPPRR